MLRVWRVMMIAVAGVLPAQLSTGARSGDVSAHDFKTFVIDPTRHQLSLHWKNSQGLPFCTLKTVKMALDDKGQKVLAVMNAGIYDKKYRPLGLHVEGGQVLRPVDRRHGAGNFYLHPNGIFFVGSSGAAIVRTADFKLTDDITLATQSGPLLFDQTGLHPAFVKKSKHKHFRNAIGVRKDGHIVFAMSIKPVTFWQLAHFLREESKCEAGLYLDGFISQLWQQGQKGPRGGYPFVGILAVTERKK